MESAYCVSRVGGDLEASRADYWSQVVDNFCKELAFLGSESDASVIQKCWDFLDMTNMFSRSFW